MSYSRKYCEEDKKKKTERVNANRKELQSF